MMISDDVALYLERRERTLSEVRALFAGIVRFARDPGDIDPDAALFGTGLGLDSLDAAEIIACLETELGVDLGGGDPARLGLRTVSGVVDAVMRARGELA